MPAMADFLLLRFSPSPSPCPGASSSALPHSHSHLPQCCPPRSSSPSPPLNRASSGVNSAIPTGGFGIGHHLRRLRASQHVGGGSVERNDAAATGPSAKPEAKLTAKEAVEAQMNALAQNDHPRADHGLEVMYHFADAEGALNGGTLSQYFGFPSDLYHFGHFALKFKSRYPEMICHNGYEIVHIQGDDEDHCEIRLKLTQLVEIVLPPLKLKAFCAQRIGPLLCYKEGFKQPKPCRPFDANVMREMVSQICREPATYWP